ncbi:hypothetical protein VTH06DRAFT_187 [Thermothelomyces fergusii]
MESSAQTLSHVHDLYVRTGGIGPPDTDRPPAFKVIGIGLAVGSGAFIGTSFVLKKVGLLKANEKYNEVAGEGYGYLKNFYWWAGMILMILGEGLNFAAYAFTDAILVTPLGALSVVITTILSAIFLKERLSLVGKIACFLCIVGSVVIVMNAPKSSSVSTIQEMKGFVIHPAFLTYAGVIIVGSAVVAFWLGPKYGSKNMLVYISICSWIGGLSVVATQGLGAAIVAEVRGTPQFNQWFLYVLLVFVLGTLLTEIVYLNKALNIFNAAMVTPTYYVYFTTTTLISSAVLFRGFKGTPTSIVTMVNGFLTICAGVVLLQLSKSAKDVPDAAVFSGDLDQIHTIAEQEQPETEPKADAIRGTAAIVRRLSSARQKMELDELKRIHEEKLQESLASVTENGAPQYEWDGIRRRRATTVSTHRSRTGTPGSAHLAPPTSHPPLGWSHFPTEEELAEANRPISPALSSIVGTIRTRARGVLLPGHPDFRPKTPDASKVQSPIHPVQLTSVAVAGSKPATSADDYNTPQATAGSSARRIQFGGLPTRSFSGASKEEDASSIPPTPPPHGTARRQFSFQSMFKRHQHDSRAGSSDGAPADRHRPGSSRHRGSSRGYSGPHVRGATEEETLGLVQGDSNASGADGLSVPTLGRYADDDDDGNDRNGHHDHSNIHGRVYDSDKDAYDDDNDDYDDDDIDARGYAEKRYRGDGAHAGGWRLYGYSITKGYTATPGARLPRSWRRDGDHDMSGLGPEEDDEKRAGEVWQEDEEEEEEERSRRRAGTRDAGLGARSRSADEDEDKPPPPPPHGGIYRGDTGAFI